MEPLSGEVVRPKKTKSRHFMPRKKAVRVGSDNEVYDYEKPIMFQGDGITLKSSVLPGSSIPYSEKEEGHVRTVTIRKNINFYLKPFIITEGPMKGHEALVLVPMGAFRFLDLPAEIRNTVYELLIIGGHTSTRLCYIRNESPDGIINGKSVAGFPTPWNDRENPRFIVRSLLLTNKQAYTEAFSVLYRSHEFYFNCKETLHRFFPVNQTAAKYVTTISLSRHDVSGRRCSKHLRERCIKDALKVLGKARPSALRTLRFAHDELCPARRDCDLRYNAKTLVEQCIPVLNTLYRIRHQENIAMDIDEVVKISHLGCVREKSECREFDEQVKEEVRERFMMDS